MVHSSYATLSSTLALTLAGVTELRQKHAYYTELQRLVLPYADASQNIQPNLIGKGSELAKELDKMRQLVAQLTESLQTAKNELALRDVEVTLSVNGSLKQGTQDLMEMHGL